MPSNDGGSLTLLRFESVIVDSWLSLALGLLSGPISQQDGGYPYVDDGAKK